MKEITIPFIAFINDAQTNTYQVLLVNPTTTHYARVVTLTGAHMSVDDDLIETSRAVKERGALPPTSTLEIESGEIDDLEFRAWYHLDLYEEGVENPIHKWFTLPGIWEALSRYKPETLPVVPVQGQLIGLESCSKSSIEEEIKTVVSDPNHAEQAQKLVMERITGFRKGTTDVHNWTHSIRVRDALEKHGFGDAVVLAGLLHDIVEDGNTSLENLLGMGFPDRTVCLVDLCSHDSEVTGSEARWMKMMSRLVDAGERDAWAIKVADITDNLRSCHTMPEEKQHFMRFVKGELMLRLSKPLLGDHAIWQELNELVNP